MDGGGILPGAKDAHRPSSRRALRPNPRGSKKALLTFDEKDLREVLVEEYEWQWPMVRDLLRRLTERQKKND